MITGDNKLTAEAISRKIGLFSEEESLKGKSFTGREYSVLTPDQQRATLEVSCEKLQATLGSAPG